MRVDLPSGRWVEFRDPSTLTERDRRPVRLSLAKLSQDFRSAQQSLGTARDGADDPPTAEQAAVIAQCVATVEMTLTQNDLATTFELNDLIACAMITAADDALGLPVPCTPDDVTQLAGPDYDKVVTEAAEFFGAFTGADFSPSEDPQSPTPPSPA